MQVSIRPYQCTDRQMVRFIYGMDEFARPRLLARYPRMSEYLADEMSYYPDYEPESLIVAEVGGKVVGALLGAVDTGRFEKVYQKKIRWFLIRRLLAGVYGLPGWLPAILQTEWANRAIKVDLVDRDLYPAHLHIGVLPAYRRNGVGTKMMEKYGEYLRSREINGYHLFASSFHPLGIAFYQKLGMQQLGQFTWRLHNGFEWLNVIEFIFTQQV